MDVGCGLVFGDLLLLPCGILGWGWGDQVLAGGKAAGWVQGAGCFLGGFALPCARCGGIRFYPVVFWDGVWGVAFTRW